MITAAAKALSQILSPPMRSILWKSAGFALILIVIVAVALQRLLACQFRFSTWLSTWWQIASLSQDRARSLCV